MVNFFMTFNLSCNAWIVSHESLSRFDWQCCGIGILRSCNKTFPVKGLSNSWRCFVASIHCSFFTNIKEIFSGLATSPQSRGRLLTTSSEPCIPRFVSWNLFCHSFVSWVELFSLIQFLFNISFVQMLYHWLMHLTILITTLVQFLDVMMETCIQNCMRLHGRILSTNQT